MAPENTFPSFPPSQPKAQVPVRSHKHGDFAKRSHRRLSQKSPARNGRGSTAGRVPGASHPDSRCTLSPRSLSCPATVVKFRSRPASSGFPPSLAFLRGSAMGDRRGGAEAVASVGPPRGVAGGSESSWCFHPPLRVGPGRVRDARGGCPGPQLSRLIRCPARPPGSPAAAREPQPFIYPGDY